MTTRLERLAAPLPVPLCTTRVIPLSPDAELPPFAKPLIIMDGGTVATSPAPVPPPMK